MKATATQREAIAAIPLQMEYLREEPTGKRFLRKPVSSSGQLDEPAVCVFLAAGMFLGTDTYFRDLRTVCPGEDLELDAQGMLLARTPRFDWAAAQSDAPGTRSCADYLDELEALLDASANTLDDGAVLALSGGLDSRSLAATLSRRSIDVRSYSYTFEGGDDELKYGRKLGQVCGFQHHDYTIPNGYLWDEIDRFPGLTDCYAEFTHPRQLAVVDRLSALGDTFYLGHWGDVLFDDFGLPAAADPSTIADLVFQRVGKSSGLLLAGELWREHGLEGTFEAYLRERVTAHVEEIKIGDSNARMRAFKSIHWAPRWTSVNLSILREAGRLVVPYYTDAMCEFVRSVPEQYLKGRQLQIEFIKRKSPALASIPWQAWDPFNLYTWRSFLGLPGIPVRAVRRMKNEIRRLRRRPRITQNWQNQFLGRENASHLSRWLFETSELSDIVPMRLVRDAHDRFLRNPAASWHAVSMLLTLAVFAKNKQRWIERG